MVLPSRCLLIGITFVFPADFLVSVRPSFLPEVMIPLSDAIYVLRHLSPVLSGPTDKVMFLITARGYHGANRTLAGGVLCSAVVNSFSYFGLVVRMRVNQMTCYEN